MPRDALTIWTVYRYPRDYPGKWVARAFDVRGSATTMRADCVVCDTLPAVRAALPPGLYRPSRQPADDPVIYEVWL